MHHFLPLCLLWLCCLFAPPVCLAQMPIDSTFANNGLLEIDIDYFDQPVKTLTLPNGKLLLLANTGKTDTVWGYDADAALLGINSNGIADADFGANGGKTVFDFTNLGFSEAKDMVYAPDETIWILGQAYNPDSIAYRPFCLAKFLSNGLPDTAFANRGTRTFSFSGGTELPYALALQPDGRLIAAGGTIAANGLHQELPAIARFLPNGSIDTTWGQTGKIVYNFTAGIVNPLLTSTTHPTAEKNVRHSNSGFFTTVLTLPDGKILCAGAYSPVLNYQCLLMRFNANGTIDSTYAQNGIAAFDIEPGYNNYIQKMLLQNNGQVILALSVDYNLFTKDFYLMTIDSSGQLPVLNNTFDFNGNADYLQDIVLQSNGKIICAGRSVKPLNDNPAYLSDFIALCRLDSTASAFDLPFSDAQNRVFSYDTTLQMGAYNVTLQPNQQIVLSGLVTTHNPANYSNLLLCRILNNESFSTTVQPVMPSNQTIIAFPNPTQGLLTVYNPAKNAATLKVFTTQGIGVYTQVLFDQYNTADLSFLPAGVYILNISRQGCNFTQKIIKSK